MLKEILTARTRPSDKALYNIWAWKISGGWSETTLTGTLPLTFSSRATQTLTDYRIYGTAEGVGVQTESGEPTGYKLPLTVESGETENLFDKDEYLNAYKPNVILNEYGNKISSTTNGYSTYKINVIPEQTYTIKGQTSAAYTYFSRIYWLGSNDEFLGRSDSFENVFPNSIFTFTTPQNCYKIEMQFSVGLGYSDVILVKGSIAPDHYIPYRYSTTTPIYIGASKLMAEEYVDYESGKVYKRTENSFNKATYLASYKHAVLNDSGVELSSQQNGYSTVMYPVSPNTTYSIIGKTTNDNEVVSRIYFFYANQTFIARSTAFANLNENSIYTFTTPNDARYIELQMSINESLAGFETVMLILGSTPPASFIPYLQPTDPPVPLPAITAYQGENTMSSTETVGSVSLTGKIKEAT